MVDCQEDVDGPSASLVDIFFSQLGKLQRVVVFEVKVQVCRVAAFSINCFHLCSVVHRGHLAQIQSVRTRQLLLSV